MNLVEKIDNALNNLGGEKGSKFEISLAPKDYYKLGSTIMISIILGFATVNALKTLFLQKK